MQHSRFNLSIAAIFALTVLFIPIGDALAQTQLPIFIDDIVASIDTGSEVVVAPVELQQELSAFYGQPATVSPLGDVIDGLSPAASGNTVRFEGGWAEGEAASQLQAAGYTTSLAVEPQVAGAGVASVLSD